MKVSIVIPAFNQQELLLRSLETWFPQRREFHECIVVDDGSKERLHVPSWAQIARIEREPVPRGSSAAKNHGAALASGDTLIFADSDILHMPDAVMSLKHVLSKWEDEGEPDVLLDVFRISLPEGFPERRTRNVEGMVKRLRTAGLLFDDDLTKSNCCWEQNCGMIRKELFERVGGYDAEAFQSWGFNNHDLCARVYLAGGRVSSAIPRVLTGKRLFCFHIWHEATREREQADKEFAAKWGEPYTVGWMDYIQVRAQRDRNRDAVQG